jgi:hypothetical protein
VTLALIAAAIIPLRWVLLSMPTALRDWAILLLLLAIVIGVSYLGGSAQRRLYVVFEPQAVQPPPPRRLDPADKVAVYPTGQFEVEGKSAVFADLLAYWRTFASREHTVMAIARPSRFLLVGHAPARELGMWYVFFTSEMIEAIIPGTVAFGGAGRLGLRVAYRHTPSPAGARKPSKPITQILYMGFEDETARQVVWADMLAD